MSIHAFEKYFLICAILKSFSFPKIPGEETGSGWENLKSLKVLLFKILLGYK